MRRLCAMTNPKRRSFLEGLLGKKDAEDLRADTRQAAEIADAAGMERKAVSEDPKKPEEQMPMPPPAEDQQPPEPPPPPAEVPAENDPVMEAAGKLSEQVFTAV